MRHFSLLQVSLDQKIDRESLEEASVVAQSVARADCAYLQRDLFGIVVSNLPLEEAMALQVELKRRGFLTDVVPDRDLPTLHPPFTVQRIEIQQETLCFTDMMGRQQTRTLEDLVFVAGGFLSRSKMKSAPAVETNSSLVESEEFRLDFFFWSAPNRLRAVVAADSTMFFAGRALRLRDTTLLQGAMMDVRELLPAERVSSGLKQDGTAIFYPSLKSYEEEIRWSFYRLAQVHDSSANA